MDSIRLRRKSWQMLLWAAILGLGIAMIAAVYQVTATHGFRTGWQGIPVYFALIGIAGQVANCSVILRDDALLVVNPLRTHIVPKSNVNGVSVGDDGTLEVYIDRGQRISVFAFGGSLIDRFKDTSSKAERAIDSWLRSDRAVSETKVIAQARWTRSAIADWSFILCVVISVAGVIWMNS